MACQAIHSWTFCGLVGAFLDLAITYFILCCSTIAFFVSKFLGFFGLTLPCPCNGLFGNPNPDYCFQRLLVNWPTDTLSDVQLCIKTRFPFDSIWARNEDNQFNLKLARERKLDDGRLELRGDAFASSISGSKRSHCVSGSDCVPKNEVSVEVKEGRFDLKGKGIMNQRLKSGLRRRRRGSIGRGNFTSSSSLDHGRLDVPVISGPPSSIDKIGNESPTENSIPFQSNDGQEPSMVIELRPADVSESNAVNVDKYMDRNSLSSEDHRDNTGCGLVFDGQAANVIRILEQTLEEEQAARATLCSELEEERTAAAIAADEAMAMIVRLTNEKASISMEARQYQRILEEKSAYDAEEMDILKEIIVRKEREKHVLEKEVEAYRNMLLENELLEGDVHAKIDAQGQNIFPLLDSSEDPLQMLQQVNESIGKIGRVKFAGNSQDSTSASGVKQNHTVSQGKELPIPERHDRTAFLTQRDDHQDLIVDQGQVHGGNELGQGFQEKGMVSVDEIPTALQKEVRILESPNVYKSSRSQNHYHLEKTLVLVSEHEQNDKSHLSANMTTGAGKSNDGAEMPSLGGDKHMDKRVEENNLNHPNPWSSFLDTELNVYDIHVIDDKCQVFDKDCVKKDDSMFMHDGTSNVARKSELLFEASNSERVDASSSCPAVTTCDMELNTNTNCSDIFDLSASVCGLPRENLHAELRRNAMSAVDHERLKINIEVGRLWERLRTVQEGREKLNFSSEYPERDKTELQLLEDIANWLRETPKLTEPQNTVRQASLPPPSSKATSKKRRCRSSEDNLDYDIPRWELSSHCAKSVNISSGLVVVRCSSFIVPFEAVYVYIEKWLNKEKQRKVYEDVVADSALFMYTLEKLHAAMGTKFMIPIMGGRDLDLHRLFVEVTSRGGIEKILREKRWKEVTATFSFPPTSTNASFILRKYYYSLLQHYEQVYLFKALGWTPLPPPASAPSSSPSSSVGCPVVGVIDGKFESGYLVTVTIGTKKMKGVLYQAPSSPVQQVPPENTCIFASRSCTDSQATSSQHQRRRRKSEKRKRDPAHPKPNRSGYNFFFAEHHARLRQLYPGRDREISRMIGELWTTLDDRGKAVYQEKAMKDKERYRIEMEDYRERLRSSQVISDAVPIRQRLPGLDAELVVDMKDGTGRDSPETPENGSDSSMRDVEEETTAGEERNDSNAETPENAELGKRIEKENEEVEEENQQIFSTPMA
ncbi:hypothetical protein Nepgr_022135 [Nepenthes gracilis]|uniref:Uncharacterized protein n=1 Tax=Nepenthes gracilis TaxID=150966 RepID=A0AAD3XXR8_NEPGR|nr:hypothetical protein Nepgr_022135 [Nepenthes gracilis]